MNEFMVFVREDDPFVLVSYSNMFVYNSFVRVTFGETRIEDIRFDAKRIIRSNWSFPSHIVDSESDDDGTLTSDFLDEQSDRETERMVTAGDHSFKLSRRRSLWVRVDIEWIELLCKFDDLVLQNGRRATVDSGSSFNILEPNGLAGMVAHTKRSSVVDKRVPVHVGRA